MLLVAHIVITAAIKAQRVPTPAWIRGIQTVCRDSGNWWRAVPDQGNGSVNLYSGPDPANLSPVATIKLEDVNTFLVELLGGASVESIGGNSDDIEPAELEPDEELPVVLDSGFFEKQSSAEEVDVTAPQSPGGEESSEVDVTVPQGPGGEEPSEDDSEEPERTPIENSDSKAEAE